MGQSSLVHDFRERLNWGEQHKDEPFWEAVYRKAFPNFVSMMLCPGDVESQRMGIDRVILLSNGQILKVDEKKRSTNYQDILLEYISVDTQNKPGWIEKDLTIDYLAYAFINTQQCYLFPWLMLRKAWTENKDNWLQTCNRVTAKNRTYNTLSVAVPINKLYLAVNRATRIDIATDYNR